MRELKKYNIHPSIKEVWPEVFGLVSKRTLLVLKMGLKATSNKDQILDNLHYRRVVKDGENYKVTTPNGNVVGHFKESSKNGSAYLYYNSADITKATKIEAFAWGDASRDVCTVNPTVHIREIDNGYELNLNETSVNGLPWKAAQKNEDFQYLRSNFAITNVEMANQVRDEIYWIGGLDFKGADDDNIITISNEPNSGADYILSESDINDVDKEAIIIQFQNGSGVGKGTFGYLSFDLKTYCPNLYK